MPAYRSRTTTHGRNMAGARGLWRATGMKDGDFGKPIIAVVNSFTQFVPGHVHLKDLGQMVAREIEKAGGDKVRQPVKVKTGIDSDNAKKIQTLIKQSKLKVQAQIQGDVVRISGNKRDDLQVAIQYLKKSITDLPLTFTNFRE